MKRWNCRFPVYIPKSPRLPCTFTTSPIYTKNMYVCVCVCVCVCVLIVSMVMRWDTTSRRRGGSLLLNSINLVQFWFNIAYHLNFAGKSNMKTFSYMYAGFFPWLIYMSIFAYNFKINLAYFWLLRESSVPQVAPERALFAPSVWNPCTYWASQAPSSSTQWPPIDCLALDSPSSTVIEMNYWCIYWYIQYNSPRIRVLHPHSQIRWCLQYWKLAFRLLEMHIARNLWGLLLVR